MIRLNSMYYSNLSVEKVWEHDLAAPAHFLFPPLTKQSKAQLHSIGILILEQITPAAHQPKTRCEVHMIKILA